MKECCKLIGSELYVSDDYAINGSVSDLVLVRCQAEVWTWSLFILLVHSQWVLYFSMYLLCALFFVDGYFIDISLKWIEARTFCFADAMTVNIAQMIEISCIFCLCILLPCWSIVVLKIKYSWILNPESWILLLWSRVDHYVVLTHLPPEPHVYVSESGEHWIT